MKLLWKKLIIKLKAFLKLLVNWHFFLCIFVAYFITNLWAYLFLGIGFLFHIPVLKTIALAYIGFLWLPFTPEKVVTVFLAFVFLRWWFPNDTKAMKQLKDLKLKEEDSKHKFDEKPLNDKQKNLLKKLKDESYQIIIDNNIKIIDFCCILILYIYVDELEPINYEHLNEYFLIDFSYDELVNYYNKYKNSDKIYEKFVNLNKEEKMNIIKLIKFYGRLRSNYFVDNNVIKKIKKGCCIND